MVVEEFTFRYPTGTKVLSTVGLSLHIFVDIMIAGNLVGYLHAHRSGLSRSDAVITDIIRCTLGSLLNALNSVPDRFILQHSSNDANRDGDCGSGDHSLYPSGDRLSKLACSLRVHVLIIHTRVSFGSLMTMRQCSTTIHAIFPLTYLGCRSAVFYLPLSKLYTLSLLVNRESSVPWPGTVLLFTFSIRTSQCSTNMEFP